MTILRILLKNLIRHLAQVEDFSHLENVHNYISGGVATRWVLMLPGGGCQWAREFGGCYMCGFNRSIEHLPGKKIVTWKIRLAYKLARCVVDVGQGRPYFVAIYNAGSFLNPREIPHVCQKEIIRDIVRRFPSVKNILIESRPEFISIKWLGELKKILRPGQSLTIAIGLECESDEIRTRCIHKGFTQKDFIKAVKILTALDIKIWAYVFLKPIYLTEAEAIAQAVATIRFCYQSEVQIVGLESAFIQEGTKMHELYQRKEYFPPWLWSIIEVVRRARACGPIHIGSFQDEPMPIAVPKNCGKCDARIIEAISRFNQSQNLAEFDGIQCDCFGQWKKIYN